MRYIRFEGDTPYCGTSFETYMAFDDDVADDYLDELAEEFVSTNAESYEYLATGWDTDDIPDEELEQTLEDYHLSCEGSWLEVSKEEYIENTGE